MIVQIVFLSMLLSLSPARLSSTFSNKENVVFSKKAVLPVHHADHHADTRSVTTICQTPTFTHKSATLETASFNSIPNVDHIEFVYKYLVDNIRHTATVKKNSAGSFTLDFERKDSYFTYSVKYLSSDGKVLHKLVGAYEPTTFAVLPLHHDCNRRSTPLGQSPTFTNKDGTTENVIFPSILTVDNIEFTYKYLDDNIRHTANVQKNSAGYFSYDFERKNSYFTYSVRYWTSDGTLVHKQDGAHEPSTKPIVPLHHVVRRGTTVLHDTFSSNHLDLGKWTHDITCWGGGNNEFQMYTPEAANTYIKNGVLYMRPTFTADKFGDNFLHSGTMDVRKVWGTCTSDNEGGCYRTGKDIPPIMSSKLHSKASISHGRVEVVAQIPKGDWLWPAIWLLPPGWPWKYGGWPASGEIDIMEARGNLDLKDYQGNDQGVNVVYSTIHWGPTFQQHKQAGHWRKSANGNWADGYHTYSLDWTADHIRMDVDNQPIFSWATPHQGYWSYSHYSGNNVWSKGGKDAPFDGKFSLILNVAVGGQFFNDNWINKGSTKPWQGNSGSAMADFWKNKGSWQPTWHGEDVAMKIKSVKMIQY